MLVRLLWCKSWKIHLGWGCWGVGRWQGTGRSPSSIWGGSGWCCQSTQGCHHPLPRHPAVPRAPGKDGTNCAQLTKVQSKGWGMSLFPAGAKWDLNKFAHHQCQHSVYKPSLSQCFHDFLIRFQHGKQVKTINIRWEFHPPTQCTLLLLSCSSPSQNLLLSPAICWPTQFSSSSSLPKTFAVTICRVDLALLQYLEKKNYISDTIFSQKLSAGLKFSLYEILGLTESWDSGRWMCQAVKDLQSFAITAARPWVPSGPLLRIFVQILCTAFH